MWDLPKIVTPKLMCLFIDIVSKQIENVEIEFMHYTLDFVSICILNKTMRDHLLDHKLRISDEILIKTNKLSSESKDGESLPFPNYIEFLRFLETQERFKGIKKMH